MDHTFQSGQEVFECGLVQRKSFLQVTLGVLFGGPSHSLDSALWHVRLFKEKERLVIVVVVGMAWWSGLVWSGLLCCCVDGQKTM